MKERCMIYSMRRACSVWAFLLLYLAAMPVWAFEPFVIKDIKINGLQRISIGTVLNYLPLKVGETLDEQNSAEAIRALYKTGFFKDVRFEREANVLVINVVERPSIASVTITGNKEIDTETLTKALKQVGLAENQVFDRSLLDKVEQELQRQYFNLGKYAVKINSKVTPEQNNRVAIAINIAEGQAARIRRINIIGNKVFDEGQLVKQFQLTGPTIFSFFSDSDKYSKQKLRADLESLRSYYLDRGYINFEIVSTQVSITPNKKDIYITINISEGDKFTVSDVKLAGEMVVPREDLLKLISIKKDDTFSRKQVTEISNAINERLGDVGYAFANINAIPDINSKAKTVGLTFFVDPGKRVYVRRINITGNSKTQDEVIRRELRQFEGGWFTPNKLARSRVRLQRLGYFEDIGIETPPVAGTADQVDVDLKVTEGSTGNLQAGVGYGQPQGIMFNAKVTFNNFVGTGKRISLEANNDKINTIYSLLYTNPYYTDTGISRGFNFYYRKTNAGQSNVADYNTDDKGASVNYGIPISEYNTARFGMEFKNTQLNLDESGPQSYLDFRDAVGSSFNTLSFNAGWSHDTRNRVFLADEGSLSQLSAEIALPGADLEYYKLSYNQETNWPIGKGFTIQAKGLLAYGNGYDHTDGLPFFEHFFAGGIGSVRGFDVNSLGPIDEKTNRPVGGNIKMIGNLELIFPLPFVENSKAFRLGAFVDAGNVFNGIKSVHADQLRSSYGVSALWVTPIGALSFNWGWPFHKREGDRTRVFDFTIGAPF